MPISSGLVGPKPRTNVVGDGHPVDIPEPPRDRPARVEVGGGGGPTQVVGPSLLPMPPGSKGVTRTGSPSAFWLYASKPVGGGDRQIRPLSFNPEQRWRRALP